MAWKEVQVLEQRKLFIKLYLEEKLDMATLCNQFGISRPTGYKWVERYEKEGLEGLSDRSRAPINQALEIDPVLVEAILSLKLEWPEWGPKKLRGDLIARNPTIIWPSTKTIGRILARNGLTRVRKVRKRFPVKTDPLSHATEFNRVWSVDFKGWWLTKDGHKCEPLTLVDNFSRFLLRCVRLNKNDGNHVWAILEAAFREYGLPDYMRNDNGPPFATSGVGRLSRLSINLIKAGVIPEWIDPGNPQQNGRHERVHGTLQREGVFPELDLVDQQKALAKFQNYYNFRRPHETLGQVTPGSIYRQSLRVWNGCLKAPEYTNEFKVGRVRSCGKMPWKGGDVYVGRVLAEEVVGLLETEEGLKLYFGPVFLGTIKHKNELEVLRRPGRVRRKYRT